MSRLIPLVFLGLFAGMVQGKEPDFTLQGIDGRSYSLSDFRGKWVVVNYWATWCPPCMEEIPELVIFHERHKDRDAVVLGVNMEELPAETLRQFADDNLVSYPILLSEIPLSAVGPIPGLPTTYLINPEGKVMARKVGGVTAEGIETFIAGPLARE